jgi:hypothetical protein
LLFEGISSAIIVTFMLLLYWDSLFLWQTWKQILKKISVSK